MNNPSLKIKDTTKEVTLLAGNLLSLTDAAKLLGYSSTTLYKHHKRPGMPPYILRKRRLFYRLEDLITWNNQFKAITPGESST